MPATSSRTMTIVWMIRRRSRSVGSPSSPFWSAPPEASSIDPWIAPLSRVSSFADPAISPSYPRKTGGWPSIARALPGRELLQALHAAAQQPGHRCEARLRVADRGDERGTRDEVDHVVLTEVDEREAEARRVAPPGGALHRAGLGEQDRRQDRGRDVKRGHRRPWVAAQRLVHERPRPTPEGLADLDHDPPHPAGAVALFRRPPRRRGRHQGIGGAPEVVRRGELSRGARG